MSIESFSTARLQATRITGEDVDVLRRLYRDPEVMRTLSADGSIMDEAAIRERVAYTVEHWTRHGFGWWIFRDRDGGGFVGRGGLTFYRIDDRDVVGLSYAVISESWGRGFATEMAAASLRIGFDRLGLAEIGSWTLPVNRASRRVMEKLGFAPIEDFAFAGLPHRRYRLTASDWRRIDGEPRRRE